MLPGGNVVSAAPSGFSLDRNPKSPSPASAPPTAARLTNRRREKPPAISPSLKVRVQKRPIKSLCHCTVLADAGHRFKFPSINHGFRGFTRMRQKRISENLRLPGFYPRKSAVASLRFLRRVSVERGSRSIHNIPQRFPQQCPSNRLATFRAHVAEALLGVKRRVRIDNQPVMTRMLRIAPGDNERVIFRRRLMRQHIDRRAGKLPAG